MAFDAPLFITMFLLFLFCVVRAEDRGSLATDGYKLVAGYFYNEPTRPIYQADDIKIIKLSGVNVTSYVYPIETDEESPDGCNCRGEPIVYRAEKAQANSDLAENFRNSAWAATSVNTSIPTDWSGCSFFEAGYTWSTSPFGSENPVIPTINPGATVNVPEVGDLKGNASHSADPIECGVLSADAYGASSTVVAGVPIADFCDGTLNETAPDVSAAVFGLTFSRYVPAITAMRECTMGLRQALEATSGAWLWNTSAKSVPSFSGINVTSSGITIRPVTQSATYAGSDRSDTLSDQYAQCPNGQGCPDCAKACFVDPFAAFRAGTQTNCGSETCSHRTLDGPYELLCGMETMSNAFENLITQYNTTTGAPLGQQGGLYRTNSWSFVPGDSLEVQSSPNVMAYNYDNGPGIMPGIFMDDIFMATNEYPFLRYSAAPSTVFGVGQNFTPSQSAHNIMAVWYAYMGLPIIDDQRATAILLETYEDFRLDRSLDADSKNAFDIEDYPENANPNFQELTDENKTVLGGIPTYINESLFETVKMDVFLRIPYYPAQSNQDGSIPVKPFLGVYKFSARKVTAKNSVSTSTGRNAWQLLVRAFVQRALTGDYFMRFASFNDFTKTKDKSYWIGGLMQIARVTMQTTYIEIDDDAFTKPSTMAAEYAVQFNYPLPACTINFMDFNDFPFFGYGDVSKTSDYTNFCTSVRDISKSGSTGILMIWRLLWDLDGLNDAQKKTSLLSKVYPSDFSMVGPGGVFKQATSEPIAFETPLCRSDVCLTDPVAPGSPANVGLNLSTRFGLTIDSDGYAGFEELTYFDFSTGMGEFGGSVFGVDGFLRAAIDWANYEDLLPVFLDPTGSCTSPTRSFPGNRTRAGLSPCANWTSLINFGIGVLNESTAAIRGRFQPGNDLVRIIDFPELVLQSSVSGTCYIGAGSAVSTGGNSTQCFTLISVNGSEVRGALPSSCQHPYTSCFDASIVVICNGSLCNGMVDFSVLWKEILNNSGDSMSNGGVVISLNVTSFRAARQTYYDTTHCVGTSRPHFRGTANGPIITKQLDSTVMGLEGSIFANPFYSGDDIPGLGFEQIGKWCRKVNGTGCLTPQRHMLCGLQSVNRVLPDRLGNIPTLIGAAYGTENASGYVSGVNFVSSFNDLHLEKCVPRETPSCEKWDPFFDPDELCYDGSTFTGCVLVRVRFGKAIVAPNSRQGIVTRTRPRSVLFSDVTVKTNKSLTCVYVSPSGMISTEINSIENITVRINGFSSSLNPDSLSMRCAPTGVESTNTNFSELDLTIGNPKTEAISAPEINATSSRVCAPLNRRANLTEKTLAALVKNKTIQKTGPDVDCTEVAFQTRSEDVTVVENAIDTYESRCKGGISWLSSGLDAVNIHSSILKLTLWPEHTISRGPVAFFYDPSDTTSDITLDGSTSMTVQPGCSSSNLSACGLMIDVAPTHACRILKSFDMPTCAKPLFQVVLPSSDEKPLKLFKGTQFSNGLSPPFTDTSIEVPNPSLIYGGWTSGQRSLSREVHYCDFYGNAPVQCSFDPMTLQQRIEHCTTRGTKLFPGTHAAGGFLAEVPRAPICILSVCFHFPDLPQQTLSSGTHVLLPFTTVAYSSTLMASVIEDVSFTNVLSATNGPDSRSDGVLTCIRGVTTSDWPSKVSGGFTDIDNLVSIGDFYGQDTESTLSISEAYASYTWRGTILEPGANLISLKEYAGCETCHETIIGARQVYTAQDCTIFFGSNDNQISGLTVSPRKDTGCALYAPFAFSGSSASETVLSNITTTDVPVARFVGADTEVFDYAPYVDVDGSSIEVPLRGGIASVFARTTGSVRISVAGVTTPIGVILELNGRTGRIIQNGSSWTLSGNQGKHSVVCLI